MHDSIPMAITRGIKELTYHTYCKGDVWPGERKAIESTKHGPTVRQDNPSTVVCCPDQFLAWDQQNGGKSHGKGWIGNGTIRSHENRSQTAQGRVVRRGCCPPIRWKRMNLTCRRRAMHVGACIAYEQTFTVSLFTINLIISYI